MSAEGERGQAAPTRLPGVYVGTKGAAEKKPEGMA